MTTRSGRSGIAGLIVGVAVGFLLNIQDAIRNKDAINTLYHGISFQFLLTGGSGSGLFTIGEGYTTTILMFTLIFGIVGFGIGYLIEK